MGFVDKFVEVFRLRTKLNKMSAEMTEKGWSQHWSFMWGYELYNKTVLYASPMFEKLLKPLMEERTQQDRIKGSLFLLKLLKAHINALMISMNNEYLKLMNITLFEEVIYKFLDPTSSQFVVIALVRAGMVYGNNSCGNHLFSRSYGLLLKKLIGTNRNRATKSESLNKCKTHIGATG